MAHSLLDHIQKDERSYSIPLRPQSVVLGKSEKIPVLPLFSSQTEL